MKKRLMITIMFILITISLSGCSSNLSKWANTKLPDLLYERGELNKNIAYKYMLMGAITEDQYNKIEEKIDDQVEKYTEVNDEGMVKDSSISLLSNAVSYYKLADNSDHPSQISIIDGETTKNYIWNNVDNYIPKDGLALANIDIVSNSWVENNKNAAVLSNFVLSNYLHVYSYGKSGDNSQKEVYRDDKSEIQPIEFIPEDLKNEINEKMYAEIYVLKGQFNTKSNSLDGTLKIIEEALANDNETKANAILENYFMPLKDDSGNPITLVDKPAKGEETAYDMIVTSKDNPDNIYKLGYDMPVSQTDFENCLRLRLVEFSEDNLDALNSLKATGGKFKFIADSKTTWRAYLVEYPISVIDSMEDIGNDEVKVDFTKSAIGINLATQELINYATEPSGELNNYKIDYNSGSAVNTDKSYLNLDSAANESEVSQSSFVVKGSIEIELENLSGKKYVCDVGRVILRDYLELTYAPECVDDENLAVFGRKIRFDMENSAGSTSLWRDRESNGLIKQYDLVYKKDDKVAWFVNENGIKLNNSNNLTITDFCSAASLLDSDYSNNKVVSILESGLSNFEKESTLKDGQLPKQSDLLHVQVTSSIHPTLMFPSEEIGSVDYVAGEGYTNQRFYGIVTTKGLFDSGLSGDWIFSSASTESFVWWLNWLRYNKFGYDIIPSRITDYIVGNYEYEIDKKDLVILDLDIVSKLQQQFDENSNERTTTNIRTIFMILGWALILYSFLLAVSWVLDTNADLGIKLMEKLTLGHWVAVRYAEDIPAQNVNECTYLTASTMIIRCLLMIAMGSLLILINVFDLVLIIIKTFGGIAESIEKIITGMR